VPGRALTPSPLTERHATAFAIPSPKTATVPDSLKRLLSLAEEDVLMLFPALNISRQTAERGLDIFEKSL
jgi:hypothetical protein